MLCAIYFVIAVYSFKLLHTLRAAFVVSTQFAAAVWSDTSPILVSLARSQLLSKVNLQLNAAA